eukprot:2918776-Alexandrium_andersonii.AAC.1
MVRIRQEIACGLPMVCRGRLGNPTLGPLEETVRAGDPDETGRRAPMLYADWTSGFPNRREDAPHIEPYVGNVCDWMQSYVENPRPHAGIMR